MRKIAIACLVLFLSTSFIEGGFLDLLDKNEKAQNSQIILQENMDDTEIQKEEQNDKDVQRYSGAIEGYIHGMQYDQAGESECLLEYRANSATIRAALSKVLKLLSPQTFFQGAIYFVNVGARLNVLIDKCQVINQLKFTASIFSFSGLVAMMGRLGSNYWKLGRTFSNTNPLNFSQIGFLMGVFTKIIIGFQELNRLDNSESARCGDYGNNRWDSIQDAANLLCEGKLQQNRESSVGIMSLAGRRPDVLLTPITDNIRLNATIMGIKIHGKSDFMTGIQIAQMALKHRSNKSQRQRIVVFVASPIEQEPSKLVALGKKLKKNNVAIDVINLSDNFNNLDKLNDLVSAANNSDNSHILTLQPGTVMVADALFDSPILQSGMDDIPAEIGGAGAAGGGVGPSNQVSGDSRPSQQDLDRLQLTDPELATALRISMEEQRRAEEKKAEENDEQPAVQQLQQQSQQFFEQLGEVNQSQIEDDNDGDYVDVEEQIDDQDLQPDYELDEQEMMAAALKMSTNENVVANQDERSKNKVDQSKRDEDKKKIEQLFEDEDFIKGVLKDAELDVQQIGKVLKEDQEKDKKEKKGGGGGGGESTKK